MLFVSKEESCPSQPCVSSHHHAVAQTIGLCPVRSGGNPIPKASRYGVHGHITSDALCKSPQTKKHSGVCNPSAIDDLILEGTSSEAEGVTTATRHPTAIPGCKQRRRSKSKKRSKGSAGNGHHNAIPGARRRGKEVADDDDGETEQKQRCQVSIWSDSNKADHRERDRRTSQPHFEFSYCGQ